MTTGRHSSGMAGYTRERVVWRPQRQQAVFQSRPEYEVLYGGAAGGGKSDALLAEALRQAHIKHYRGLILRKTYKQLNELEDRSYELYRAAYPRARYNKNERCWRFPSGAKVYFGGMQHTSDRHNYQGKRYDFIGFDELTHFTWEEYSYLMSRNRPGGPGTRVYMRATTNPGGVGHGWVRNRFIDVAPPLTTVTELTQVVTPEGQVLELPRTRTFVPATVFDNPALLNNDPNYLANLALLPEAEQQALLYGSWDSFTGQVFREWRNDPAHYDDGRWTHVINPIPIPANWIIVRGFDMGYATPFSVGWHAFDTEGRCYRIAEFYGCGKSPNTGISMHPGRIAEEIKRVEREDPNLRNRDILGIADPSIFASDYGEDVASIMASYGVYWQRGDNERIAGKMQFHYRLAFDSQGLPMFQVFNTCRNFIRTFPALVYSETHPEDVDTTQEDHIYDECRYVMMTRQIAPRENVLQTPPAEDPLRLWADRKKLENLRGDPYVFYRTT